MCLLKFTILSTHVSLYPIPYSHTINFLIVTSMTKAYPLFPNLAFLFHIFSPSPASSHFLSPHYYSVSPLLILVMVSPDIHSLSCHHTFSTVILIHSYDISRESQSTFFYHLLSHSTVLSQYCYIQTISFKHIITFSVLF